MVRTTSETRIVKSKLAALPLMSRNWNGHCNLVANRRALADPHSVPNVNLQIWQGAFRLLLCSVLKVTIWCVWQFMRVMDLSMTVTFAELLCRRTTVVGKVREVWNCGIVPPVVDMMFAFRVSLTCHPYLQSSWMKVPRTHATLRRRESTTSVGDMAVSSLAFYLVASSPTSYLWRVTRARRRSYPWSRKFGHADLQRRSFTTMSACWHTSREIALDLPAPSQCNTSLKWRSLLTDFTWRFTRHV